MLFFIPAVSQRAKPRLAARGAEGRRMLEVLGQFAGVRYEDGVLSVIAEPRVYELLCESGLEGDQSAKEWYDAELERERQTLALLSKQDAVLIHPAANNMHPYQRVGAQFILQQGNVLLGDDMGLGKSIQTIVAVECSRWHENILVVCPNTVKGVWAAEHAKWSAHPEQPVLVIEAEKRRAQQEEFTSGWVVTNYEALQADAVYKREPNPRTGRVGWTLDEQATAQQFYWSRRWDWIIFDEAHRLKSRASKTYMAIDALQSRRTVCLTGTPLQNEPAELWTLLHILDPQRYSAYWRFFGMYVDYTEDPIFGGRTINGVKNEHLLRREIAPIVLRREKQEVLPQLPPKTEQTLPVTMTALQRRSYTQMQQTMLLELRSGRELYARTVITQILRLRQLLSTPANFDLEDSSGKLDAVEELVGDTTGKLLVFTLFRRTVSCLQERLHRLGVPYATLIGGMSGEEIEAAKAALNDGDAKVLLATIGAGGVGHTLTGASTVVFVDQHWNPAMQAQAVDRCHRIGQRDPVHVLNLLCHGTVDDRVAATLIKKIVMARTVLGRPLVEELLAAFVDAES